MQQSVSAAIWSAIRCIYLNLYQSCTELQETFSLLTLTIPPSVFERVSVLSWPHVRCVIYWMVFKAQCSHSTAFHSTVHTSPYSAAQYTVCWSSFEMCVFPLYLSFEWSYDPDGTTALCVELSQEVSDGVWGKHTPGLHTSAHTYPYI